MKQVNWFDRKFQFEGDYQILPSIIERLKGTPIRLKEKMADISTPNHPIRIEEKWSMLQNIGHLIDLEPIWQGRLEDIIKNEIVLRAADLSNAKTNLANHNNKTFGQLISLFKDIREITIQKLERLSQKELLKSSLHPRLKTPMRIVDLFLFVAEHDDHHLARITEIERSISK